jgi:hypothetical protein
MKGVILKTVLEFFIVELVSFLIVVVSGFSETDAVLLLFFTGALYLLAALRFRFVPFWQNRRRH